MIKIMLLKSISKLSTIHQFLLNIFLLLMIFSLSSVNASSVDVFSFKDEVTKQRFQTLSKELRCPKCQNQNLADSNAKIAVDLRKNLYMLLMEGKTDQEIIDFMVYRYGEFVLYRPQLSKQNYILWFGPVILLCCFVLGVIWVIKHNNNREQATENLSRDEQRHLDNILKK